MQLEYQWWSTYGTIIDEGLDIFIEKLQEKAESNEYLNKLKQQDNYEEIKEALAPNDYNMIVTPKEIDDLIENMKDVIARGINYAKDLVESNTRSVSAISPGVLGTTGIESYEIVNSIVQKTNPDMLIVIDSLASKSIYRIGNTIQLSNTGITPGEGVRNKREALNQKSLGIPVIAIGVPTVVDLRYYY